MWWISIFGGCCGGGRYLIMVFDRMEIEIDHNIIRYKQVSSSQANFDLTDYSKTRIYCIAQSQWNL